MSDRGHEERSNYVRSAVNKGKLQGMRVVLNVARRNGRATTCTEAEAAALGLGRSLWLCRAGGNAGRVRGAG